MSIQVIRDTTATVRHIAQAAADWDEMRMGQVPGEMEFIPLPEHRFVV